LKENEEIQIPDIDNNLYKNDEEFKLLKALYQLLTQDYFSELLSSDSFKNELKKTVLKKINAFKSKMNLSQDDDGDILEIPQTNSSKEEEYSKWNSLLNSLQNPSNKILKQYVDKYPKITKELIDFIGRWIGNFKLLKRNPDPNSSAYETIIIRLTELTEKLEMDYKDFYERYILMENLLKNKKTAESVLNTINAPNILLELYMTENASEFNQLKLLLEKFINLANSMSEDTIETVKNAGRAIESFESLINTILEMQEIEVINFNVPGIDNELYKDVKEFTDLKIDYQLAKTIELWNNTLNDVKVSPEYPGQVEKKLEAFQLKIEETLAQFLLENDKYKVQDTDSNEIKTERLRIQNDAMKKLIVGEPFVPDDTNLQILIAISKSKFKVQLLDPFLPVEVRGNTTPELTPFKVAYLQKKVKNENLAIATQNLINAFNNLKYVLWKNSATLEQRLAFEVLIDDQELVKQAKRKIQKQIADKLTINDDLNAQILLAVHKFKTSGDIKELDKWIGDKSLRYQSDTLNNLKLQYVIDQLNDGIPINSKKSLQSAIINLLKIEYEDIKKKYDLTLKKFPNMKYYYGKEIDAKLFAGPNFFFYNIFGDINGYLNNLRQIKFPRYVERILVEKTINFQKPEQINVSNNLNLLTSFKWDRESCWAEASFNALFCYPGNDLDNYLWKSNKVYVPEKLKVKFEDNSEAIIENPEKCGKEDVIFETLLNDIRFLQDPKNTPYREICKTAEFFTGDNCFLDATVKYAQYNETFAFVANIKDFFNLPIGFDEDETKSVLYTQARIVDPNYILTGVVLSRPGHFTCLIRDFNDKWWFIDNFSKYQEIYPGVTEVTVTNDETLKNIQKFFPSRDTEGRLLADKEDLETQPRYEYKLEKFVHILKSTWEKISKKEEEDEKEFRLTDTLIDFDTLSEDSQTIVKSLKNYKGQTQIPKWFDKLELSEQLKEAAEFYLEENNSL
jgi:hypothetical protein